MSLPPLVEPAAELTVDEVRRYSRHLIIPDVGMDGQKRLKNAKVLCVGAGGLGSPALMYLAAAGVGTLGIVEFDEVDESNLQRQIIHSQADIGRSKAQSAKDSVLGINPYVNVVLHEERLEAENVKEIFAQYDLIVDGTDNFATRYLVNDAAVLLNKPYVWGSIYRFDGQASVFWSEHGPCYRCLYPEPPPPGMVPSCAEGGVLGVLCASVGSIQVTEAIKLLAGIGDPLVGRLMIYDALGTALPVGALGGEGGGQGLGSPASPSGPVRERPEVSPGRPSARSLDSGSVDSRPQPASSPAVRRAAPVRRTPWCARMIRHPSPRPEAGDDDASGACDVPSC
ncbi:hypothetical protein SCYAM73S_01129 [Streptomyces cyaneofuscatus]